VGSLKMKTGRKASYNELFKRYDKNPILSAEDWPYPVNSVFNAGAAMVNGETLLLARVEDRSGLSHLCVARSKDGITNWNIDTQPTLPASPETHPEEIWGIEDPRITWLEEEKIWIVAYTAYSLGGPMVSLAKTQDFITFNRLGNILPPEDKDAAVFPVKFGGRYALLHRPVCAFPGVGAHIWISYSPDLKHWGDHKIVLHARRGGWWDANKIGLSPPPLQTPDGWLILYHGIRQTVKGAIYRLGIALLDLENPNRVIKRSDEWIFAPEAPYEKEGDVDDVVFPCGWILQGNEVRLYYGGADKCIALAIGSLEDILEYVKKCPSGEFIA